MRKANNDNIHVPYNRTVNIVRIAGDHGSMKYLAMGRMLENA